MRDGLGDDVESCPQGRCLRYLAAVPEDAPSIGALSGLKGAVALSMEPDDAHPAGLLRVRSALNRDELKCGPTAPLAARRDHAGAAAACQTLSFTVQVMTEAPDRVFTQRPAIAPDGTLRFALADDFFGRLDMRARLWDAPGALRSWSRDFTVVVQEVNLPPAFDAVQAGPFAVLDVAGEQELVFAANVTPGSAFEAAQTLTWRARLSRDDLFATPPVFEVRSGPTGAPGGAPALQGVMRFAVPPLAAGAVRVGLVLEDDGPSAAALGHRNASRNASVLIEVARRNRAPLFALRANASLSENAGERVLPGFARGISPGSAFEAGQRLSFTLAGVEGLAGMHPSDGLFEHFSLGLDGALRFKVAQDRAGDFLVSVALADDGPGAPPHANRSIAEFALHVAPTVADIVAPARVDVFEALPGEPPRVLPALLHVGGAVAGLFTAVSWEVNSHPPPFPVLTGQVSSLPSY